MTDDQDFTVDPMTQALITQLHTYGELLQRDLLTVEGMQHVHRFCLDIRNATPGNASVIREGLASAVAVKLAAATGVPESYWTDKQMLDVPDDIGDLDV